MGQRVTTHYLLLKYLFAVFTASLSFSVVLILASSRDIHSKMPGQSRDPVLLKPFFFLFSCVKVFPVVPIVILPINDRTNPTKKRKKNDSIHRLIKKKLMLAQNQKKNNICTLYILINRNFFSIFLFPFVDFLLLLLFFTKPQNIHFNEFNRGR